MVDLRMSLVDLWLPKEADYFHLAHLRSTKTKQIKRLIKLKELISLGLFPEGNGLIFEVALTLLLDFSSTLFS